MFSKIDKTAHPPKFKPLLVYDGNCGFCKYWIIKWKRLTYDHIDYSPYQKVLNQFEDIPEHHFKEAVRFINLDGTVGNGPEAAFQTLKYKKRYRFLHRWYAKYTWFQKLSDFGYQWVADHRNFLFKVSRFLFGKKP